MREASEEKKKENETIKAITLTIGMFSSMYSTMYREAAFLAGNKKGPKNGNRVYHRCSSPKGAKGIKSS